MAILGTLSAYSNFPLDELEAQVFPQAKAVLLRSNFYGLAKAHREDANPNTIDIEAVAKSLAQMESDAELFLNSEINSGYNVFLTMPAVYPSMSYKDLHSGHIVNRLSDIARELTVHTERLKILFYMPDSITNDPHSSGKLIMFLSGDGAVWQDAATYTDLWAEDVPSILNIVGKEDLGVFCLGSSLKNGYVLMPESL